MHDRAGRMPRRGQRMRIERGIGIDDSAGLRRGLAALDLVDVRGAVHARDLLARRRGRRVVLEVRIEARGDQAIADRGQPLGAFGVVGPHLVQQDTTDG